MTWHQFLQRSFMILWRVDRLTPGGGFLKPWNHLAQKSISARSEIGEPVGYNGGDRGRIAVGAVYCTGIAFLFFFRKCSSAAHTFPCICPPSFVQLLKETRNAPYFWAGVCVSRPFILSDMAGSWSLLQHWGVGRPSLA